MPINYALFGGVCISERDPTQAVHDFQRCVRAMLTEIGFDGPVAWVDDVHGIEHIDAAEPAEDETGFAIGNKSNAEV